MLFLHSLKALLCLGISWVYHPAPGRAVGHLLQRVHREANSSPESEQSKALFNELLSYPGVIDFWKTLNRSTQHDLVLGIHLKKEDLNLRFFSTIATLGTPNDITLQEIRIECLFPADEVTDHTWNLV